MTALCKAAKCHVTREKILIFSLVSLPQVSHPNEQEIAEQTLLKDLHLALPKSPSHESVPFAINVCKEGWIQTLTFDPKPTPEASSSNEILQIELDNPGSVNLSVNLR